MGVILWVIVAIIGALYSPEKAGGSVYNVFGQKLIEYSLYNRVIVDEATEIIDNYSIS